MIQFTNVVKTYQQGNNALNGATMQIEDGEFVFLIGPSGSGKSTIIKLITGELKPTSGTVHVNGYSLERIRKREIPYLRRTVGVVFQDFRLIDTKTVYENVAFAMRAIGAREGEIRDRVPYILELVGLEPKSRRHPNELSGGEQQRLAIARAVFSDSPILLLDEATSALDNVSQKMVSDNLDQMGCTRVVIAHRLSTIRHCDRIIVLDKGHIAEEGTYEELKAKGGLFAEMIKRQEI